MFAKFKKVGKEVLIAQRFAELHTKKEKANAAEGQKLTKTRKGKSTSTGEPAEAAGPSREQMTQKRKDMKDFVMESMWKPMSPKPLLRAADDEETEQMRFEPDDLLFSASKLFAMHSPKKRPTFVDDVEMAGVPDVSLADAEDGVRPAEALTLLGTGHDNDQSTDGDEQPPPHLGDAWTNLPGTPAGAAPKTGRTPSSMAANVSLASLRPRTPAGAAPKTGRTPRTPLNGAVQSMLGLGVDPRSPDSVSTSVLGSQSFSGVALKANQKPVLKNEKRGEVEDVTPHRCLTVVRATGLTNTDRCDPSCVFHACQYYPSTVGPRATEVGCTCCQQAGQVRPVCDRVLG